MPGMVDDILSTISAEDLAQQLGTDPDTAMDAARKALPALLGGLSQETRAGKGDALGEAVLRDHDGNLLDQPNPLAAVDTADGQKIVEHMFGGQRGEVEQRLGSSSSGGSSIFSKLLPMLAPLVMAWLSKRMGGVLGGRGATRTDATDSGGGLGGMLGDLVGGGDGGGLGGLLGGLLGGEVDKTKESMPDLGGLFDMFGGGDESSGSKTDTGGIPDVGEAFDRGKSDA